MKVKTFAGTDAPEVDKLVNDWLAESKVQVRRTSTAFHRFRDRGKLVPERFRPNAGSIAVAAKAVATKQTKLLHRTSGGIEAEQKEEVAPVTGSRGELGSSRPTRKTPAGRRQFLRGVSSQPSTVRRVEYVDGGDGYGEQPTRGGVSPQSKDLVFPELASQVRAPGEPVAGPGARRPGASRPRTRVL